MKTLVFYIVFLASVFAQHAEVGAQNQTDASNCTSRSLPREHTLLLLEIQESSVLDAKWRDLLFDRSFVVFKLLFDVNFVLSAKSLGVRLFFFGLAIQVDVILLFFLSPLLLVKANESGHHVRGHLVFLGPVVDLLLDLLDVCVLDLYLLVENVVYDVD